MTKDKKKETKKSGRTLYLDLSFLGALFFFLFRIPITNIIGNEGNGYFAFSWELYTVLGLLFGHCLMYAVSDMVRKRVRKNQYQNSRNVLTKALILGLVLSAVGCVICYFGSDVLLGVISMKLSGIGLRMLGIMLVFSTLSGVFCGYFEGIGTRIPTSFSKIVEGFIAGTGALVFASALSEYGTKVGELLYNGQYKPAFGAAGIVAGCICGSVFAMLFLMVINRIYQVPLKQLIAKEVSREAETAGSVFKEMFKLFLVVFIELVFFNVFRIINMWLYIRATLPTDMKNKIVQYLGAYHGKFLVITSIAILIVLMFTGRNVPRICRSYQRNNVKLGWKYFGEDIKQIMALSLPFAILLAVLAKNLYGVIYKSSGNIEVTMLQIGSVNIILVSLAVYMYRILRKLDMTVFLIIIPLVALVVQTVVMYFVVQMPDMGALSLIISEVVFWFVVAVMEIILCIKTLKQGFKQKI